jgi:hypothetical protein
VHAVSLTPHAQKNFRSTSKSENHMQNNDGMQRKKLKMHAVSLTPHAKYDTACMINERFERPWQPFKGISIKTINVPELSYPTTKKIYKFKGAIYCTVTKNCRAYGVIDTVCVRKSIISRIRSRIQKGFSS